MAILNSVAECLAYIEKSKIEFPVLHELISAHDLLAWERKLADVPSLDDFLLGPVGEEENAEDDPNLDDGWEGAAPVEQAEVTKWNLLSVTFTAGFCGANGHETDICRHAQRLLTKLSLYLETFPELKLDKRFLGKIRNLVGVNFLATLSELSLAYQLHMSKLNVTFETPFKLPGATGNKDVDLTATHPDGYTFHLEVYTPSNSITGRGFFNLKEDDQLFKSKIRQKLFAKFGREEIQELNGRVFLAVNIALMDMLRIKRGLFGLNSNYQELARVIPRHIDGLLLFDDDFGTDNSFHFQRLLLKE
ncbi:hypothetical protein [Hymenobacter pini]|uniref:hypothetical protein n=1 Tax=Hymenobacter pini TaxID=2880879 RepID=UPI001CF260B0|nr:hypothetical protein [Hymenobacter pini]MCA8833285.1 hypothetical protein [Hymenobacter pini]